MADGNTLHILNHFSFPVTIYVSADGFNCCDAPLPGAKVGYVLPDGSVDLFYQRKDGHGCNGKQGQFQLELNVAMIVSLNFDSGGVMADPSATGCHATLGQNNTLIVYA